MKKPERTTHRRWRTILVITLVILASISVLASITVRYVRDNILDTDGYMAIMGPLPKDPAVAAALSSFATEKLFDITNAQQNIEEFLPPKLAPLATPLTDSLQKRVNDVTKNLVASDQFSAIWLAANRSSHDALIKLAESKEQENSRLQAVSSLNLQPLLGAIRERMGNNRAFLSDQQKDRLAEARVNLHQDVSQLRTGYRLIQNSATALPYFSFALLMVAIAVAYNRRHTILGIGLMFLLLGAITIITFKVVSGTILDDITNPIYRSAADTIYHAFYDDFHRRIVLAIIVGFILALFTLLAGPYAWARSFRGFLRLNRFKTPAWMKTTRQFTAKYELWFLVIGIVLLLITLIALASINLSTIVIAISVFASLMAIVHMIARPSPHRPPSL